MKKTLILILCVSILMTGCKDDSNVYPDDDKKDTYTTTYKVSDGFVNENGDIIAKPLEMDGLNPVPSYFQQDYDVDFGCGTMEKHGNKITCLSMVYSYFSCTEVPPDLFYKAFKEHINNDGTIKDSIYEAMKEKTPDISYIIEPFDIEKASLCMHNSGIVMVEINHPSIYGKYTAYLLLLCTDGQGYVAVCDPDKNNLQTFAIESPLWEMEGFTWYNFTSLLTQIGTSSNMVLFGGTPIHKGE